MQIRAPRLRVLWHAIGYLLIGLVVVFSLMPNPPEGPDDPGNWSGHLLAYGTLMAWFAQLHERLATRLAIAPGFVASPPRVPNGLLAVERLLAR